MGEYDRVGEVQHCDKSLKRVKLLKSHLGSTVDLVDIEDLELDMDDQLYTNKTFINFFEEINW